MKQNNSMELVGHSRKFYNNNGPPDPQTPKPDCSWIFSEFLLEIKLVRPVFSLLEWLTKHKVVGQVFCYKCGEQKGAEKDPTGKS